MSNTFKGLTIDTHEWVYGRLLSDDIIVPLGQEFEVEGGKIYQPEVLKVYKVFPNSVVPSIGLFDSSHKEIYDGDILRFEDEVNQPSWIGYIEYGNPGGSTTWGYNITSLTPDVDSPIGNVLLWIEVDNVKCENIGNLYEVSLEFKEDVLKIIHENAK